jgi:hypothetical protein
LSPLWNEVNFNGEDGDEGKPTRAEDERKRDVGLWRKKGGEAPDLDTGTVAEVSAVSGRSTEIGPAVGDEGRAVHRFEKCATPWKTVGEDGSEGRRWTPDRGLRRTTCKPETRKALSIHMPEIKEDDVLYRYVVYALWTTWRDEGCHRRVIDEHVLHWIGHHRFTSAIAVIRYIKKRLPGFEWIEAIPNRRARLIKSDGLPRTLYDIVRDDLRTPASECEERVRILSGKTHNDEAAGDSREDIKERLSGIRPNAPSLGAQYIWERMNERPPNPFAKLEEHLEEAHRVLDEMDLDVSLSSEEKWHVQGGLRAALKRKKGEEQRQHYRKLLRAIADQHKPFYRFSSKGRTDRIFPLNDSVLSLPKELRTTLCQDFREVDLKSAHLLIAAWLWDATEALRKLADEEYSIWDDLMEHCRPLFEEQGLGVPEKGDPLYAEVKSAMKVAVYSTVYGMPAPSIQAELTKSLSDLLGGDVGAHIREHPVVQRLLKKRDEKLAQMEVGDVYEGPTGIRAKVEQEVGDDGDGADPRSVMATIAQSYEQACMRVILELEEDREKSYNRFRVALWLHDGAYVKMESPNARERNLTERLNEKCRELAEFAGKDAPLPAFFEVEKVEAPELAGQSGKGSPPSSDSEATSSEMRGENEAVVEDAGHTEDASHNGHGTSRPKGPAGGGRVPVGQEPRTLREDEKTELPVLHVSKDGLYTIGPEPEHVAKLYPTRRGARQVYHSQAGVYWLTGGVRRDGEWATDSTLYEVKMNGSYHFVEIHRHRGIRDVPDLEVGRLVFGRYRGR